MFDIQRTMTEAYDRARRILYESSSDHTACKSGHVGDTGSAVFSSTGGAVSTTNVVSMPMSLNHTGHRSDCPATCTCFLVCTLSCLYNCFFDLENSAHFVHIISYYIMLCSNGYLMILK